MIMLGTREIGHISTGTTTPTKRQHNHSSNLGEFLFPGRVESVVPLLLFWALFGFLLLRALSLRAQRPEKIL
jgi:hypothetical protein